MKMKTLIVAMTAALSLNALSGEREVSYALEDAAFQAAMRMDADARVAKDVKRIAFVKLWLPKPGEALSLAGCDTAVMEASLGAVPCRFDFVLHDSRSEQWTLIDQVFDQAQDFESYDPATHPELGKLQLCDALLLAKVIDCADAKGTSLASVRVSFKLIEVKTSRQVWGAVIEGQHTDGGPDNQALNLFARRAMELAAADAVAKLPRSLDGYGVFLLPLEGEGGRAMTQLFLNALTAAGRQDKIHVYDLPNGNASDRMFARFLRERAGAGQAVDSSILRKIEAKSNGKVQGGKLAILTGMVTSGRIFPETIVDPTGRPIDRLTGSFTPARANPTLFEIVADLKFRDINDGFRVVAAVSANGAYRHDVGSDFVEQLRSFVTVRNAVVLVVVVLLIWFVCHFMLRVR